METAFEKTYSDEILGKLTAIDRLIFHGHLMCFFRPGSFETFLWQQQVLLKNFKDYVSKATTAIRDHALKMAADARRPWSIRATSSKSATSRSNAAGEI